MKRRDFVQKTVTPTAGAKLFPALACSGSAADPLLDQDPFFEQVDVFIRNEGSHPAYRIPSTLVSQQGTVFRKSRILFTNPDSDIIRLYGTVRLSEDEGQTWPVAKRVTEGPFAYSCLTAVRRRLRRR